MRSDRRPTAICRVSSPPIRDQTGWAGRRRRPELTLTVSDMRRVGHFCREVPEIGAGRLERQCRLPRELWVHLGYPIENAEPWDRRWVGAVTKSISRLIQRNTQQRVLVHATGGRSVIEVKTVAPERQLA